MEPISLLQRFVEHCDRARSIDEAGALFQDAITELGFRYFACCSHVDPLNRPRAAVMLHNYPMAWVRTFSLSRMHLIDPVLMQAERSPMPFFWDAADFRARLTAQQTDILQEAASYGLAHGCTSAIHASWMPGIPRASCSLVPGTGAIDAASYSMARVMAAYIYGYAVRGRERQSSYGVKLTPSECECLMWVGASKTDEEIGQLLGLSRWTVHKHIEKAKARLGVRTRTRAVIEAFKTGQISLEDPRDQGGNKPRQRPR